jgi:hypothetical protein
VYTLYRDKTPEEIEKSNYFNKHMAKVEERRLLDEKLYKMHKGRPGFEFGMISEDGKIFRSEEDHNDFVMGFKCKGCNFGYSVHDSPSNPCIYRSMHKNYESAPFIPLLTIDV